jgi:hypothetical protein
VTPKDKRPPLIDLHESEWSHEKKREPVLGVNGLYFLIMFPVSFAIGTIASIVATGELPYFLR